MFDYQYGRSFYQQYLEKLRSATFLSISALLWQAEDCPLPDTRSSRRVLFLPAARGFCYCNVNEGDF